MIKNLILSWDYTQMIQQILHVRKLDS